MPSIETESAFAVCQVNCTWSPAEITVGVAVKSAVGAPPAPAGASPWFGRGCCFFLHPETAVKATSRREKIKMDLRCLKGILLLKKSSTHPFGAPGFLVLPRAHLAPAPIKS
jgi:hypothetical protein